MKENEARELILNLFQEAQGSRLTTGQVATALALRGKAKKKLRGWLIRLVVDGRLVETEQRYRLALSTDRPLHEATGTRPRASDAQRLPRRAVLSGRQKPPARAGRPARHPEPLPPEFVGTLRHEGKSLFVVPADWKSNQFVRIQDAKGARINDRVVVRLSHPTGGATILTGQIVEVLGPSGELSVETLSAIRHYGLSQEFPDNVLKETDKSMAFLDDPGPRMDCRDKFVLTIDPERARDFDDALSLETDSVGNRVLGVHIADVGHFVRPGTALDCEARRRGNSVYLPDRVLPMLPPQLSNGICSLRPDEDRFAFSVFLTFDSKSKVLARRFAKSIIRNRVRLTYEQALRLLLDGQEGGGDPPAVPPATPGASPLPAAFAERPSLEMETRSLLKQLSQLAQQLRKRRFDNSALDLDVPETEIILDSNSQITGVRLVMSDISHQLIEECMVIANESVATELQRRGIDIISRLHEPPSDERIMDLTILLGQMGFNPGDLTRARSLSSFLRTIRRHPLGTYVRTAVLKSMKRAVYSASKRGHFGLAKRFYSHFTSPIRRYPDLILHRQLAAALPASATEPSNLTGGKTAYGREELSGIAFNCSTTEQTAEAAERFVTDNMKFRYLAAQIEKGNPGAYDAVVVRVMRIGAFVEVPALQVQGLIPAASLSRSHGGKCVRFVHKRNALLVGNSNYAPGRKVRVVPARVDMNRMLLDFDLA